MSHAGAITVSTGGGGTVTNVSGTLNRIVVTDGTTDAVVDISPNYVGQSSITTLGTVTTGVWNGTAIDATHGGTAQTTWATGDILYASGVNTLSKLAAGSNTNVLTLAGGVPTWAAPAASGIATISGDNGSITGSSVTIFANRGSLGAGSSVRFNNSGATSTFIVTDSSNNTVVGNSSGTLTVTGTRNSVFGSAALANVAAGASNSGIGSFCLSSVSSGSNNTAAGYNSLSGISSGQYNNAFGYDSGSGLTVGDSGNLLLANTGTAGDTHTMRLGTTGSGTYQVNKTFLAGTNGITSSNAVMVTMNSSTEQLGTMTIPAAFTTIATQTFSTGTGTYTPTSGMKYCQVEVVGGGGGGGGTAATGASQMACGAGGGAGAYASGFFSAATIGAGQTYTIAAAAAGGVGNNPGGNGGTCSLGSLITAGGGTGGTGGAATAGAVSVGGVGGSAGTGGNINNPGASGLSGFVYFVGSIGMSGQGADTLYGAGGTAIPLFSGSVSNLGNSGTGYGGGGGGAGAGASVAANNGGSGRKGAIIITEYI